MHLAVPASLGPFCFDQDKLNDWTNDTHTTNSAATGRWSRYNRRPGSSSSSGVNGNSVINGNGFNLEELLQSPEQQECDKTRDYMVYLLQAFPITQKEKLRFKEVYPQNHMRNIARKVSILFLMGN